MFAYALTNSTSQQRCYDTKVTCSSAMAQRPHELGDFMRVGQFEAKVEVERLRFSPMSMGR